MIRRIMTFTGHIVKSFFRDDCLNLAANISFCTLLALIPILMLMVSTVGFFLGASQELFQRIVTVVTDILPFGREVFLEHLQSVLDQRASLGIIGVLFLLFISTILVASIERALDATFKAPTRRNFWHSRFLGICIIFGATLLFSLPTMVQILEGLVARYGFHLPLAELMTGKAYYLLVSFCSYITIMVIVPNRKVYIRYAALGGLFFAIGLGVVKFLFRAYMVFAITRYSVIYGSLTAVILSVIWIYYIAVLLLLSAEFVASMQEAQLLHREESEL